MSLSKQWRVNDVLLHFWPEMRVVQHPVPLVHPFPESQDVPKVSVADVVASVKECEEEKSHKRDDDRIRECIIGELAHTQQAVRVFDCW